MDGSKVVLPPKIKLVMTLVVKDEQEIIETHIRFHKEMGVDGFIVTNHNSSDNTLKILEKLKKEGLIYEIITETSPQHKHSVWVDKMIRIAKDKYHATWVINADADEFYYSKDLNLKESIAKYPTLNVIKVESTFSFPTDEDNIFDNVYFNKNPLEDCYLADQDEWMQYFSLQYVRTCPKVIHSTKGYKMIGDGNHTVEMENLRKGNNVDIVLYHYHIVNYRRYEEKAKKWAISSKFLPMGKYLTRMIDLLNNNQLRADYDNRFGLKIKNRLEELGVISKDYSVLRYLKYKKIL